MIALKGQIWAICSVLGARGDEMLYKLIASKSVKTYASKSIKQK